MFANLSNNYDLNTPFDPGIIVTMKYYIWMDAEDRPLSKAWRYEDETERMAAERKPPSPTAVMRAGTREQLIESFGIKEQDFADS